MRIDNNNSHITYKDFWDWLFNYKEHGIYLVFLAVGYYLYLTSTTELG